MLLRTAAAAALTAAGLFWMNSFAPLQVPSVLAYSGIVLAIAGAVSVLLPKRWTGFASRLDGPLIGLTSGAVLFCGAWFWPSGLTATASPATQLDAFMPVYNFHERHEVVIQASPEAAWNAMNTVSAADLRPMKFLGEVRAVALRQRTPANEPTRMPMLEMIRSRRTGFFPLHDSPDEFVFGLAGQPWNNAGVRLSAEEFVGWNKPGNVKIAANFRVEDLGNGRSRVVTETRVLATDADARRKMGRYWALIYPGSGMIRRSLLQVVKARAEQPKS